MSEPQDADATPWPDISYVTRSKPRAVTLQYLHDHGPATPSTIADGTSEPIASISHALNGLTDRGLVELLVPEDVRKGRYYGATEGGHEIASQIQERGITP